MNPISNDAPFQPPRKKLNIFWWIGGFFLLLVIVFVVQLFGPNPPIVVSPQTTYITGPLRPDGLPNYSKYVLEHCRKGVTPQNNAAALLWPALWPGELDPTQYATVAAELGLDRIPSTKDAVTKLYSGAAQEQIAAWLEKQQAKASPAKAAAPTDANDAGADSIRNDPIDDAAEAVIDRAMYRSWTSQQVPPLAKWVTENQKPLDKMVEASARARCYFPSPTLVDQKQESLVSMLLPGIQAVRTAARTLSVRAMWSAGENRNDAAWRDVLAIHRIGHLVAQDGMTLIDHLVGMALDGIACDGTLAILDQRSLSAEQAREILRDLELLENFHGVANAIGNGERLMYLDNVVQFRTRMIPEFWGNDGSAQVLSYLKHVRIDWNVALRKGNEYYDRLVAAVRLPLYKDRQQALAQFESDIGRLASEVKQPGNLIAGVVDPAHRSDIVASAMLALLLPSLNAAMSAEDRTNTTLELERLAAALAVHRIEHGNYPEKLEELVPGVLAKLPIDLYTLKPFVYRRTKDGYLLSSVGANGIDDGGSNQNEQVFEGQSEEDLGDLDEDAREKFQQKIPADADDRAIRMPRPPFAIPKVRLQSAPGDSQ